LNQLDDRNNWPVFEQMYENAPVESERFTLDGLAWDLIWASATSRNSNVQRYSSSATCFA
jgi:hypothetical protein